MNVCASTVALAIATLLAQSPARDARPPAPPPSSTIRGRILTDAGQPIRKARVGLAAVGHDEAAPVYTDPEGRFTFAGLAPGGYVLTASKPGYVTTRFGARGPLEPPTPITVATGDSPPVEIRLVRGAAINGHLFDDNGDPLVGVPVAATRLVRAGTRTTLSTVRTTTTDDLGEYRLPELPAGRYVITADPAAAVDAQFGGNVVMVDANGSVTRMGPPPPPWVRVYYPAAIALGEAEPLAVRAGQELTGIDFFLRPHTFAHLTITVSDPSGTAARGQVVLQSDSPLDPEHRLESFSTGEPTVVTVPPGEWNVFADGGRAGVAAAHVTIGESDASLPLVLGNGAHVSGRIVVDGAPPAVVSDAMILAAPTGGTNGFGRAEWLGRTTADGAFALDGVLGPVDLRLVNAPAQWSIQFITIGGRLLPGVTTTITGDITDLVVHVGSRPTQCGGTVTSSDGTPAPGVSVIVFPRNPALLTDPARWARWVKTDRAGRFLATGLPPGDYDAIALDAVDEAQWSAPEYLDALAPHAIPFTLTTGGTPAIDLTLWSPR